MGDSGTQARIGEGFCIDAGVLNIDAGELCIDEESLNRHAEKGR
jgi:hypothetical protein